MKNKLKRITLLPDVKRRMGEHTKFTDEII